MTEAQGKAVQVWENTRLPWHPIIEERFGDIGITRNEWKTLCDVIFPGAKEFDSILMALSYCKSRNLDVMKRMVHIVPIWSTAQKRLVDTIWPAIAELRTTAMRTKDYAGTDRMEFGPMIEQEFTGQVDEWNNKQKTTVTKTVTVKFPEFAQITVYRMVQGARVAFCPPPVYWMETYGMQGKTEIPNSMWTRRARGQLAKCCEAAALRFTFPEELGNDYAAEEMEGQQFYGPDNAKVVKEVAQPTSEPPAEAAAAPEPEKTEDVTEAEVVEEAAEEPVEGEAEQPDETTEQEEETQTEPPAEEEPAKPGKRPNRKTVYNDLLAHVEDFTDMDKLAAWKIEIASDLTYISETLPDYADEITKLIDANMTLLSAGV